MPAISQGYSKQLQDKAKREANIRTAGHSELKFEERSKASNTKCRTPAEQVMDNDVP